MNAEQIKKIASDYLNDCEKEDDVLQVFDIAVKAVEQESVLDKIRAEIEQIELLASYTRGDIKQIALDIIDKYRAESEE